MEQTKVIQQCKFELLKQILRDKLTMLGTIGNLPELKFSNRFLFSLNVKKRGGLVL